MENKGIFYLEHDRLLHIDMLETLRRRAGYVATASSAGVIVAEGEYVWMLAADSPYAAEMLLAEMGSCPSQIVARGPAVAKRIEKLLGLKERVRCHQCAYFKNQLLPVDDRFLIRELGPEYTDLIHETYTLGLDREYVTDRLQAGAMFGAYFKGELAGYIGIHAGEGAIGMLEVLPGYRRQGVALALEAYITNIFVDKGLVPFGHIVEGNEASLELQKRMGYEVSPPVLSWMESE